MWSILRKGTFRLDKKKTIKKKSVIKSQLHKKSSSELHLDKEICNQYSISKHSQYQSAVCPSSQTPHAVENEEKEKGNANECPYDIG